MNYTRNTNLTLGLLRMNGSSTPFIHYQGSDGEEYIRAVNVAESGQQEIKPGSSSTAAVTGKEMADMPVPMKVSRNPDRQTDRQTDREVKKKSSLHAPSIKYLDDCQLRL